MANYTKKAVRGISVIFIMSILANLIAYFTRIILARNLTTEEYGLFYAVFTVVIFFLFFRDIGLSQSLVKYIVVFKEKKDFNAIKTVIVSSFLFQFLSSLILAVIFFCLSSYLSKNYFKTPFSEPLLNILILYILFSILFISSKGILQAFQKFRIYSLVEVFKNLIVFLLILFFFKLGLKSAFAPALAYTVGSLILFLILLPFTLKTFPLFKYKIKNFNSTTKKLFIFGLPFLLTNIGGRIIGYIDTLILTQFRSLSEVGIYNVILPSAMLFLYLGISVSSVAFPIVSELWEKKDKKRISDGLKLLHKYAFVAIIPMVFTVFAFSELFISLFFGKEYISGAIPLQILLIGVLFYTVAGINNNVLAGIGKPKTVTKIILLSALINFVANIILIPKYSMVGAAISTSASYLIALMLSTYYVTKVIEIEFPKKIWFKLIISGAIFVSVIGYTKSILAINPWFELFISAIIASIAYLVVIYLLKIIDIKEIKRYTLLIK